MQKSFRFNKRFWEILPGTTSLFILSLPVVFSFVWPAGVAYFIILFDAYWLVKAVVMAAHLVAGLFHLKRNIAIDWLKRCQATADLKALALDFKGQYQGSFGFQAAKHYEDWQEVEEMLKHPGRFKHWKKVLHGVMFAVYKEGPEILKPSLEAVINSSYPKERVIIIIALEARAGETQRQMVEELQAAYRSQVKDFLVYVHPEALPGEIKAKGANVSWAARHFKDYLELANISQEEVILSIFDADTIVHPQYLAYLTYKYVVNPDRLRRSYQPIPLFNNNIWQVPAINRLVAFSSSFWQMIEATRPYRLVTFSSQAIPMKTLVDIDFWDKTVVNEDSQIFYRAYFHFNGDYKVVPLFIPVSMDAVLGKGFWATVKAQYLQKRRWAYGIEHFPYLVKQFQVKKGLMSLWQRFVWIARLFEGHVSWATASLLIASGGWMPILLNSGFRETVLAFNLPVLARNVLSFTWIGVLVSGWIGFQLLPKRQRPVRYKLLEYFAQWILVPIAGIFFGSIPALDAELRLMLGRYLGFRVTEKERKGSLQEGVVELGSS